MRAHASWAEQRALMEVALVEAMVGVDVTKPKAVQAARRRLIRDRPDLFGPVVGKELDADRSERLVARESQS